MTLAFTQQGENVTLQMTHDDWENLLLMIGVAIGAASGNPDKTLFWAWLRFNNELNNGNPNFTPYAIPAEFSS